MENKTTDKQNVFKGRKKEKNHKKHIPIKHTHTKVIKYKKVETIIYKEGPNIAISDKWSIKIALSLFCVVYLLLHMGPDLKCG